MVMIALAGALIELHDSGFTLTRYPHGEVPAMPQDDDAYQARAAALGYGSDLAQMSRDHELAHHLLAHLLGIGHSPTLFALAAKDIDPQWALEEATVLALQAFARAKGVSLEAVAIALGERKP